MYPQAVSIIVYVVVAAIVIFVSEKLSDYVDLLDKKTNVSGAVLGGILLAAVTSLPEFFTSLTATLFVHKNSLVLGNILGSNLFNMTLFFIVYVIFFRKLMDSKVGKYHLITMLFMGIMYALVAVAAYVFNFNNILFGWFNPVSILIIVTYVLAIVKTPKVEESEDNETDSKLTVKQIIILFIVFSLLLIGASIGLTYSADWVVTSFGMGSTFGGALFLGVATSLPELTATITLCKKKNFNAAYGNILGSCVFNFIILAIGDALSFNCSTKMYHFDQSSFLLLILGAIALLICLGSILFKLFAKQTLLPSGFIYIGSGVLLVVLYVTFLVLSNIDLHLDFAPFVIS